MLYVALGGQALLVAGAFWLEARAKSRRQRIVDSAAR